MTDTSSRSKQTDSSGETITDLRSVDQTIHDMSQRAQTYHDQKDIQNILQLREVLKTMPRFAKSYFRAIEPTTSTRTRLSYAYDVRTFFRFLQEENPVFAKSDVTEWTVDMLDQLEAADIEEYQEFLKVYDIDKKMTGVTKEVSQVTNGEKGLKPGHTYRMSFGTKDDREGTWHSILCHGGELAYDITYTGDPATCVISEEKTQVPILTSIHDVHPDNAAGDMSSDIFTRVYNTSGRLVYIVPTSQFNLWDIPAHGVLIVKQGKNVRKVVR